MTALDFFRDLVAAQKRGEARGAASICSAHPAVLRAAMSQAALEGRPLLIESTVNQVNQFGGYTGMDPRRFRAFLGELAEQSGFPVPGLMVGADHLGPYPWRGEPAEAAMDKACALAAACVRAGYRKIHLDASMPLQGDSPDASGGIPAALAAEREAALAAAAEEAFAALGGSGADTATGGSAGVQASAGRAGAGASGRAARDTARAAPVYVIGTDVPPPGGSVDQEGIHVTRVEELEEMVGSCRQAFRRRGLEAGWERVVAVVVQPGVEFGDHAIHPYRREAARALCAAARDLPGVVLEGHSTDYQSRESLRELVEDGVAVLKVGPALTFALREGLFALEQVESELCHGLAEPERSRLAEELEAAMVANPRHWRGYYQGSEGQLRLARRFSLSDRCRYYWAEPRVDAAVRRLLNNLGSRPIPLTLVSQYFPHLLPRVRQGGLEPRAAALIEAGVVCVLEDYRFASQGAALP